MSFITLKEIKTAFNKEYPRVNDEFDGITNGITVNEDNMFQLMLTRGSLFLGNLLPTEELRGDYRVLMAEQSSKFLPVCMEDYYAFYRKMSEIFCGLYGVKKSLVDKIVQQAKR